MFFQIHVFQINLFYSLLSGCSGISIRLLLLLAAANGTVAVTAFQVTSQECSEL